MLHLTTLVLNILFFAYFSIYHIKMSSGSSKPGEKDDTVASLTMEAISALQEWHCKTVAVDFKNSFTMLENKFEEVHTRTRKRVCRAQRVTPSCWPVINLEGRSQGQNVCILGLAESTEGGRHTEFFAGLLCKVFRRERFPSHSPLTGSQIRNRTETGSSHNLPASLPN